jgi:acetyltransferase-like isoleucine patch superfamily enzyme
MNITSHSSPSQWLSLKESLVLGLLEWIPKQPGIRLRNLLYRFILGRLGNSVQIKQGVEVFCAQSIEIGNEVTIDRNASLNSYGENNRIIIGDRVRIDPNACVNSAGQNSKIILNDKVIIGRGVEIMSLDNGYVEIGENTFIGAYSCVAGPGHIRIGQNCLIAAHSGIFANNHQFADPSRNIVDQGLTCKGIVIEDDCWLGSGVKVVDGVTIGQGSVIGAGAVVTKDIPPFSIAVGVPAKVISQRKKTQEHPVEAAMAR